MAIGGAVAIYANTPSDSATSSKNAGLAGSASVTVTDNETKAYVEKLAGVRSLDKIVEIQTEFARQAYETFVTESKRIRELYSGLAKQNLKPFEGFVTRKKPPAH